MPVPERHFRAMSAPAENERDVERVVAAAEKFVAEL